MAVMHSEILLVDRSTQQLYSKCCKPYATIATLYHLIKKLNLQGEHIVQIASCDIRVAVVTRSGKIATINDQLLQS